jgi:hypothetical protein
VPEKKLRPLKFQTLRLHSKQDNVYGGQCREQNKAIALIIDGSDTSETSVNFYETTWRNNTKDSHLQLKSSSQTIPFSEHGSFTLVHKGCRTDIIIG